MGSRPPAQCPICNDELDPSTELDEHLVEKHSKDEMARSISTEWESREEGSDQ